MFKPLSFYRRFYSKRFRNIGMSLDDSKSLADRLVYQIDMQGEIGALDYFKRIGDALVNYYSRSANKVSWVKLTKAGFPVVLADLRDYSEDILLRIAKVARSIRFNTVLARQVDKVRSAPIAPFNGTQSAVDEMTSLIKEGLSHSNLLDLPYEEVGLPRMVINYFSGTLSMSGKTDESKAPPIMSALKLVANVEELRVPGFENAFWPLHPDTVYTVLDRLRSDRANFVGTINASQEGGGKLRMFASPYTVVQCLLYPIHDWIVRFNKLLPMNCTYDQMSGAKWAQGKLNENIIVHSVDLSTATCRFPFEPQMVMLAELGLPPLYQDALRWACKGNWIVGKELRKPFGIRTLSWKVGQPLGLAPSMSMFTLAHIMLLYGICVKAGVDPYESFRVLGDDVLISDSLVAKAYTSLVQRAGVPISWTKSHSSAFYAEFAGCSITRKTILRPGQWRTPTIGSMTAIAESIGSPTYGEVSKLGELIQEAHLFARGEFNPPPEQWPLMLRISSTIRSLKVMNWTVPSARLKFECARDLYNDLLYGPVGKPLSLFDAPPSFVWDMSPSIATMAFKPLIKIAGEEHLETVMHFRATATHFSENVGLAVLQAYACSCFLFDVGVLTHFEELSDMLGQIERNISSLLWLPPSKDGLHRRIRKLESQYAKIARFALQSSAV